MEKKCKYCAFPSEGKNILGEYICINCLFNNEKLKNELENKTKKLNEKIEKGDILGIENFLNIN